MQRRAPAGAMPKMESSKRRVKSKYCAATGPKVLSTSAIFACRASLSQRHFDICDQRREEANPVVMVAAPHFQLLFTISGDKFVPAQSGMLHTLASTGSARRSSPALGQQPIASRRLPVSA